MQILNFTVGSSVLLHARLPANILCVMSNDGAKSKIPGKTKTKMKMEKLKTFPNF